MRIVVVARDNRVPRRSGMCVRAPEAPQCAAGAMRTERVLRRIRNARLRKCGHPFRKQGLRLRNRNAPEGAEDLNRVEACRLEYA